MHSSEKARRVGRTLIDDDVVLICDTESRAKVSKEKRPLDDGAVHAERHAGERDAPGCPSSPFR